MLLVAPVAYDHQSHEKGNIPEVCITTSQKAQLYSYSPERSFISRAKSDQQSRDLRVGRLLHSQIVLIACCSSLELKNLRQTKVIDQHSMRMLSRNMPVDNRKSIAVPDGCFCVHLRLLFFIDLAVLVLIKRKTCKLCKRI